MAENPDLPAGWYRDPDDATTQRYWDGHAWTDRVPPADRRHAWPRDLPAASSVGRASRGGR